jgi:hypothetical protein
VTELFQLFVKDNFRAAYDFVAEDTQDYYFHAPMEAFTFDSFKVTSIQFLNKDLTKASVNLECRQKMHEGEFAGKVVSVPLAVLWKIEGGQWVWYHQKGLPRHYL